MKDSPSAHLENVCTLTLPQDLCIGCGVCAAVCPVGNLPMGWSREGMQVPSDLGKCLPKCHRCLDACPFLDQSEDESSLAEMRFGHLPGIGHRSETGYYLGAYVGHAVSGGCRERGASGGLASWFLSSLLERREVDSVIYVRPTNDPHRLFSFALSSNPDEVRAGAKSAYYPVELSTALATVLREERRYAVIGLPCALKALSLAARIDSRIRSRVVVMAGLVCGQVKSKYFAANLIRHMGLDPSEVTHLSFRSKNSNRPAYNFEVQARMRNGKEGVCVGGGGVYAQTWQSGEFTPRACRFCDDVFAEVADITFMDAWLPEYMQDSRGTSIVIVRSQEARQLIDDGIAQGGIAIQPIAIDRVIQSQAGVVDQKRSVLANRLWIAGRKGLHLRKRVAPVRPVWFQRLLLEARETMRKTSHKAAAIVGSDDKIWLRNYQATMQSPRRRLNALLFPGKCISRARAAASRCLRILRLR